MRLPHLRRPDVAKPVVGRYLAGNVEYEAAERTALVGIDRQSARSRYSSIEMVSTGG